MKHNKLYLSRQKNGKSNKGREHTEDSKEKMRIAKLGKHRPKFTLEHKRNMSKMILQYSVDGEFIREWYSIQEAANELNVDRTCISAALNGRQQTSLGYKWKFK